MIVVSDTSPLNYLVLIEAQDLLPTLYGRVLIPPVVLDELRSPRTPRRVLDWAWAPPHWLELREPPPHHAPDALHPGESAAIALARSVHAALLLMDDQEARRLAEAAGLRVTGTLGVLRDAAGEGLINLRGAFEKLSLTNFRAPPSLYEAILAAEESPEDPPGGEAPVRDQ
jgi:predicted nucleic acid-binding protein